MLMEAQAETAADDVNFPTGASPGKYRSHHATLRNLKSTTPVGVGYPDRL